MIPYHFPFPIIYPVIVQPPPILHYYRYPILKEALTLRPQEKVVGKRFRMISWCPPPRGWFKINTDGAYKTSRNLGSAGGLVRNSNGRWCAGFSMNLGSSITPLEAEFMGIMSGLELAWKMGFKNIILESDCKVAVDILNNGKADDYLVRNIKELLGREWNVIVQHQYREGNQTADWLANLGIQLSTGYHEFLDPPKGVFNHIDRDRNGVSYPRLCSI